MSEYYGCVLDCVVLVYIQVALAHDVQVYLSVFGYLFEHVVEESETCIYVASAVSVDVHSYTYGSLFSGTFYRSRAFAGKKNFGNLRPSHSITTENKRLAAEVFGKLCIRITVANHIRILQVVLVVIHVFAQHSRSRLTHGRVVLGEVVVDMLGLKHDVLGSQCLYYEVVYGQKGLGRKTIRTQSVLIAHHYKHEIRVLMYESKAAYGIFNKIQLLKAVHLFVSRFLYNSSVSVNKENPCLFHFVFHTIFF